MKFDHANSCTMLIMTGLNRQVSTCLLVACALIAANLIFLAFASNSPAGYAAMNTTLAAADVSDDKIDYVQDIQPILSNYCYACHGPDTAGRKGGFRLDLREAALGHENEGIRAIIPGDPDHSEMIRLIESQDPKVRMPQDPNKQLDEKQIALLREWIRQGAEFRDHWAFEAPVKAAMPQVDDEAWCRNEIDRFVLAKLESEGLRPNAEADRAALIRRVSLDLTGLLPTPQEVDDFIADASADAYEKVVDRLLDSPRYGEHRARYWMDYARFSDTSGLHMDAIQSRWPYRDYVIKAFNADMPFDQFTREQLAGDLLPPERADQLVATGFVRCGISTGEAGSIIEELRINHARERTELFGAVYMGITTGCAACHDHKYDPLSMRDFYALSAFFNNIAEKASCDDRADWPPNILVPGEANLAAYNAALAKKANILRQLEARRAMADELIAVWLKDGGGPKAVASDALQMRLRLDENHKEGSAGSNLIQNTVPNASPTTFNTTGPLPHWGEDTMLWPGFRLETNTRVDLGNLGDYEKDQPFSCGGWIKPRNVPGGEGWNTGAGALIAKMSIADGYRGWNLYYTGGPVIVQLIGDSANDAITVETINTTEYRDPFRIPEGSHGGSDPNQTLPRGGWAHVFFTYDGSGKAAGIQIYINGLEQKLAVKNDALVGSIRTTAPLLLGRRHDGDQMQATAYQDVRLYGRELSADEVARLPREDIAAEIVASTTPQAWTLDQRKIVEDVYFERGDEQSMALAAQLPGLNAELMRLATGGDLTLVCRERPGHAYAHVLERGAYAARGERVTANVPHFLPAMPDGAPANRLGLAQWTLSSDNPLTARVTVNRAWQEVFGIGIVETSGDLGIVGERPSHPELLDWLAVDFRENGWQVKRLYKMMVMSAAYRQSSHATAEMVDRDPANRLLARGPRFRMDGEMLRDTALQAAGLLVEKRGGPSVKPYQPAGVWESGGSDGSNTFIYTQDHGENLYRRSLYTFWKRMAPMPNMEAFDATDRSSTCIRRQRTNTPLAALVLMNDPQFLEAARLLAARTVKEGGATDRERIDFLGRVLLSRPFDEAGQQTLMNALKSFTDRYANDEVTANQLLAVGEWPPDPTIPAAEQAIWMMMASIVMNSDAAINK